jgi:uncharacterized protein (DUF58 family)
MQETNVRFYVLVDSSASMAYKGDAAWASKLDCARLLAAGLIWFLLRQNDAAGMVTLEGGGNSRRSEAHSQSPTNSRRGEDTPPYLSTPKFIRPSQRPSQLGLMLRQLEQLRPAGGGCLAELLKHTIRLVHRRSVILLFSDLLEPADELASGFKQLRFHGHECIVFQVLDRDETDFPFTEGRVFQDLETGTQRSINPTAVRQKYLERFSRFMEGYLELFRGLEMAHCVVRTDENPGHALAMFLRERTRYK